MAAVPLLWQRCLSLRTPHEGVAGASVREGGQPLMLRFGLVIAVFVIAVDQATKLAAVAALWDPPRIVEVFGFFNLVPVENRGVSFGLLQGSGDLGRWLIAALSIVISIALGIWLRRQVLRLPAVGIALIIGGALGNLIDRLRQGWVIDFIDLHAGTWHWPAFNIADAGITVGVVLLLIDGLLRPGKRPT